MCWGTVCAGWLVMLAVFLATRAGAEDKGPNLGGITLRCCVLLERPYVFEERKRFSGLAIKYLHDLEQALNFKCKTVKKYDGDGDDPQGFTGFTQYFDECAVDGDSSRCKCDLGASGFVKTKGRLPRVDFATPFATDSFSIAQRTEEIGYQNSKLFFVEPFTLSVWAGLASLILTHSFVTIFDEHFKPPAKDTTPPVNAFWFTKIRHFLLKTELLRRIRYAFLQTSKHMVGAETEDRVRSKHRSIPVRQHFLQLGAILMGVFLTLSYEAALVSHLSADRPVSDFRSMEDVKNCRIEASDFCIPKGGASEDYWKNAIEASRNDCRTKSAQEDRPQIIGAHGKFSDPSSAGLNAVATKRCKFLLALTSTVTGAAHGRYCNILSVVGDTFSQAPVSFVLPKDSNLTAHIDAATVSFQQRDTLLTPIKHVVQQECKGATEKRLNWKRLGFFFYFSWVCHLIMFVYMLIDKGRHSDDCGNEEQDSEESGSSTQARRLDALPINACHIDSLAADAHRLDSTQAQANESIF